MDIDALSLELASILCVFVDVLEYYRRLNSVFLQYLGQPLG